MRQQNPGTRSNELAKLLNPSCGCAKTAVSLKPTSIRDSECSLLPAGRSQRVGQYEDSPQRIVGFLSALLCLSIFVLGLPPQAAHAQDMQVIAGWTNANPGGYPPYCAPPVPGPIYICNAGWDEGSNGNWTPLDGGYLWVPGPISALGHLHSPNAVAVGPDGSVYIADQNIEGAHPQIRRIDPNGTISTYALMPPLSTGGSYLATSVAVDSNGNVYYGDNFGNIYVNVQCSQLHNAWTGGYSVTPPGPTVPEWVCTNNTTNPFMQGAAVAPFTPNSFVPGGGSNQPITALAVDTNNNLYALTSNPNGPEFGWTIAEYDSMRNVLRTVSTTNTSGLSGTYAQSLAVDSLGNIYTIDTHGDQLLKIDMSGNVTIVGSGGLGCPNCFLPNQLTVDPHNNLYIITENASLVVKYNPVTQFATSIAGTGTNGLNAPGYSSPVFYPTLNDSFPALQTDINQAGGIALGPNGSLYIADSGNNLVRQVVLNPAGSGCQKCGPQTLTLTDPIPTNKVASYSALDPATHQIYVDYPSSNTVTVFSTVDDTVAANITIGTAGDILGPIAVDSTNHLVYVGDSTANTVTVINSVSNVAISTVLVKGSPFTIAVDPGINMGKAYVLTSANVEVSVIQLVNGAYARSSTIPLLSPSALAVDTFRQIVYVRFIGPNGLNEHGGLGSSQNYSLAVINPQNDTVTATPSISYGAPVDIATDSMAVDEGTGEVVVADGFDQFVRIYFPSTQAFSFYDPGFYPSHVAVDSINEVYYFADGYGDTAYLNNLAYTSKSITSTPDPGNANNTCGPQGSAIGVDASADQVYITTCDDTGALLHLYSGDLQGDLNLTATFPLGSPVNNSGFLSGYFTILVDSSNSNPALHSAYIVNGTTNQLDVFNGPTPGARPTFTITTPTPMSFGPVTVGTSTVFPLTIQNTGTANLNLTTLLPTILPATGPFQVSAGTCTSSTLASGSPPCTYSVTFTPLAVGSFSASLTFTDNAPDTQQTVSVTGTGTNANTGGLPAATISPSSLNFGSVPDGVYSGLDITVTNSGGNSLVISNLAFLQNGPTNFTTDFSTPTSCPGLTSGASCTITVNFLPSQPPGTLETVTLQITDNATNSPQNVTVNATGRDPNEGYTTALQGSYDFGNIIVDEPSVTAQIAVTNSGGTGFKGSKFCFQTIGCGNLTMPASFGFTSSNLNDFQMSPGTCSGVTLQPNDAAFGLNSPALPNTCEFTVTFTPSTNPQSSLALETAQISFAATTTNTIGSMVPLTGTITISGTSASLGPPTLPLTSALLVSTDNSVPPNQAAQPQGGILVTSDTASLSSGGQFVAFSVDDASNLPGPPSVVGQQLNAVYLRNTCLGPNAGSNCEQGTSFVSIGPNGAACGSESFYPPGSEYPAIDATGEFVAFLSNACQVNGITFTSTNANQIYLRDLATGTTSLVSLDSTSIPVSSGVASVPFSMSADAQFANIFAYETASPNVVAGLGSTTNQIYWTSLCMGQPGCTPSTASLVSQDPSNINVVANNAAQSPAISADGRYVAFSSTATNLVNVMIPMASTQVYLRDTCYQAPATPMCEPSTQLISQNSSGNPSTGAAGSPSVSSGGRFVVFASPGANMIPVGTPPPALGTSEIYLRDTCSYFGQQVCQTQTTTLLSELIPSSGPPIVGAASSSSPFISPDGRLIAFASSSTNLGLKAAGILEYDTCQAFNLAVTPCPNPGVNPLYSGGSLPLVDATDQFVAFDIINSSSGYPLSQVYVGQTTVPAPSTGTGSNVEVPLCDPTTTLCWGTATFSNVTSAGQTLGILNGIGPDPGYQLLPASSPVYLYVSTTAGYTGNVQICVNYTLLGISYSTNLEFLHFVNGQPPPVVIYPGTGGTLTTSQICGTVTSLSPFALALPAPTINPTSLAGGTAGASYGSVPFTTTGGQGAVNVTETGNLPLGMTFTSGISASLSGTPIEVGNFTVTITATDSQNDVGTETLALTVGCPTITLTPTSIANGTAGIAYSAVQFGQTGGVGTVTFSATGLPSTMTLTSAGVLGGTSPSQTGAYPFTVYAIDSNSCTGGVNATLTVVTGVQKTTPQITWTAPAAITYGTALSASQLDATVTPNITGSFVYSPLSGAVLGAGPQTLSVTFTPTDTTDYTTATGSVPLTVNVAPVTVTASNDSKTYGQTKSYGTGSTAFTSSGLQNGDTIGSVTLAVSGNGGAATAQVSSSPYTITPSAATGGTFTAGNYTISYATGQLVVSPATLTVTASAETKIYGQTVTFGTGSTLFTSSGLQNSETVGSVTLAVNSNGGAATAPVSGSPYTITPSATTGGTFTASNYSITYDTGTLTVTKADTTLELTPTVGTGVEILTADVSPATSGVPTGTVTFSYASTTLGTPVPLTTPVSAPAVAMLSTSDLPFGSDTVTASYSGDANFNPKAGTAPATPSFMIGATASGASVSSVTLAAGQMSSPITITLTSLTGFASQISLSCGSLPVYVHCIFTPVTIPATAPNSATTATSMLVVSVDSTNAALDKQGRVELATAAPLALLGLFSLLFGKRKRWMFYVGMLLLIVSIAGTIAGCTNSGAPTTNLPPAGAPVIAIDATAPGGVVVPLNFTVNITN